MNRNLDRRRGDQRPGRGIGQEAEIAGQQGAAKGQGRRRVEEEGSIASAIRSANRFGGRVRRRIRSGFDRYMRLGPGKRQRAILDLQTRQNQAPRTSISKVETPRGASAAGENADRFLLRTTRGRTPDEITSVR